MKSQSEALESETCFANGIIASWYLRDSQLDVYDLILEQQYPFIEAARRFGKTTSILAFVLEQLIQNPGWICRWCFPFKNQAREVLGEEVAKLQRLCPEEYRFKYINTGSVYLHPNGSKLYLRGVNEDRGESARGPASNIVVADEYGFWTEPEYIIREVLFPQLEKQEGQWLIKASTPPRDLGHKYYDEREEAIRRGRFIQKTIYDNEALSQDELQEIIAECGGVNSPAFRRERMCEAVSDPDMLVIPEWDDVLNVLPLDHPQPDFFHPYVGGDSGADDNTALLFGHYDFLNSVIVIEEELVVAGRTTKEIITLAKQMESKLWGGTRPKRRVYDAPKQLIFDIFSDHKYPVSMPDKADKMAAIHSLRHMVGQRRFKVKENCKHLRRQMKVGLWKDEKHTDFQRSDSLGHLDAIAAAIYFNRVVDLKLNPIPNNLGVSPYTHHINPQSPSSGDKTEQTLKSLFGSRARS